VLFQSEDFYGQKEDLVQFEGRVKQEMKRGLPKNTLLDFAEHLAGRWIAAVCQMFIPNCYRRRKIETYLAFCKCVVGNDSFCVNMTNKHFQEIFLPSATYLPSC
jgi:hypothetical protein